MFRLVVGLVALCTAVLFALLPLEQQTIEYTWDAEIHGSGAPLVLIERVPDEFTLTFPCETAERHEGLLFASSRSLDSVPALTIETDGSQLVVSATKIDSGGGRTIPLDMAELDRGPRCEIAVEYRRNASELIVTSGGLSVEMAGANDAAFDLTGLHWHGDPREVTATVHTMPFSAKRNSLLQKVALGLLLGLSVVSLWRPIAKGLRGGFRASWGRLYASEWLMLGLATVVALVDLPRVDDGRILSRARLLAGPDLLANVSTNFENRPLPQRWLYEWVLGTSVGWSNLIVVLRSLSMAAAVVAWILFRRKVLPALAGGRPSRPVIVCAWSIQALFVAAWFATLRPEPFIALLLTGVLAVLATWPEAVRSWPYFVVVSLMGLALATHLVGFVVVLAAVPVLWRAKRDLSEDAPMVLAGIAWGGTVSLIAAFLGSNLAQSYAAASRFRDGDDHSYGPLDVTRYLDQVIGGTSLMRASIALFLIAAVALLVRAAMTREWGHSSRRQAVLLGAALAPVGLLPTPSKWLWHLAVLGPIAVLGWAVLVQHYEHRPPRTAPVVFVSSICGFIVAWSLAPDWGARTLGNWAGVGLRHVSEGIWSSRLPMLVGPGTRWWLWIAFFVLLGVALLVVATLRGAHDQGASPASWSIAGLVLVTTIGLVPFQLLPPVVDAVVADDEWTFVGQSVAGLVSRDARCGVPARTPAVAESFGDQGADNIVADGHPMAGNSRGALLSPCYRMLGQRDGVWETPHFLMGDPQAGQRRLTVEHDLVQVGCNSFPQSRSGEHLCFSRLEARESREPLTPSSVVWR